MSLVQQLAKKIEALIQNPLFWSLLIFSTAAFFRLFFLDLIEYKFDEAAAVFQIKDFINHPYLVPERSTSDLGLGNLNVFWFPIDVYLLAPFYYISSDPKYLSFIIALMNTFMIVFFYVFLRKFYGNFVGIVSSFVLALSPWAILHSRKIWGPDLILIFLIPSLYFLHQVILNKKTNSILPLFVFLAFLIEIHRAGIFFFLITIILLIILRAKVEYKKAFLGFMIGLIPGVPFIIYKLSHDISLGVATLTRGKFLPFFDFYNFIRPFQMINGLNIEDKLGLDFKNFLDLFPVIKAINYFYFLEYFIPIAGVIYILRYKRQYLFLLSYFIVIPILYFLLKIPSYPHYFIILSPIVAITFALSFQFLFVLFKNTLLKTSIIILLLSVLLTNFIFTNSLFNFFSIKKNINGDYGPIFSLTQKYIEQQTGQYFLLPYYEELKLYGYIYPQTIHHALGVFLMKKNNPELAINEFKEAIKTNPKDLSSCANLIYAYILTNKFDEAKKELDFLSGQESTVSSQLKTILEEAIIKSNK